MFLLLRTREDILLSIFLIGAVFYALLEFYRFGNEYDIQNVPYGTTEGWSLLNRKRMEFDMVYDRFFSYVSSSFHFLILHCLICETVRYINARQIPVVHATFGIIYLFSTFKLPLALISIVLSATFYVAMFTARKWIIVSTLFPWICFVGCTRIAYQRNLLPTSMMYDEFTYAMTTNCWLSLRLASFALDYCNEFVNSSKSKEYAEFKGKFSIINFLGYSFYLPVLMQGPLIIFPSYAVMIKQNVSLKNSDLPHRVKRLTIELIRITIISFIAVLMMHYFYTDPILYDEHIELLYALSSWPLYGMIICSVLYYCMAYMIRYQLGGALAQFDRINAPKKPKCCLGTHSSTSVWRHFDRGLYEFLLRYIYIPTNNLKSKWNQFGRAFVFVFVSFWHCFGDCSLLLWVWGNFILVTLEAFPIMKTTVYIRVLNYIGMKNMRKLHTFIGGQLLIMLYCLSMELICGQRTFSHIFHETYLNNTVFSYLVLSAAAYTLYHNGQ